MTNNVKGKISVIIGIYNCASTLVEALDCIVNQTYTDWEMILCDDGSIDDTYEIAKTYLDRYPDKVVLLKNEVNLGLNATLNRCLEVSTGEYIARMDGDDLCVADRFAKQVRVLEENPDIAIVSSDMSLFDESGVWGSTDVKVTPTERDFLYGTPFCHAPCLVRREAYMAVGGYTVDKRLLRVEDYHLWIKMYEAGYRGINIKECLYMMRDDHSAIKRRSWASRRNEAYVISYAIKHLRLPFYNYIRCLKPLILGLVPTFIYKWLHKKKLGAKR